MGLRIRTTGALALQPLHFLLMSFTFWPHFPSKNGWSGDGAAGPGVVQGYKKGRISKRDEYTVQFETEEKPLVICLSKMEGAWEVIEVPAAASTPRILELSAALGAIPAPSFGACLDVLWQLLVPFYDSLLLHAHVTQRGS